VIETLRQQGDIDFLLAGRVKPLAPMLHVPAAPTARDLYFPRRDGIAFLQRHIFPPDFSRRAESKIKPHVGIARLRRPGKAAFANNQIPLLAILEDAGVNAAENAMDQMPVDVIQTFRAELD